MKKAVFTVCCLLILSFFACENDDNTIPEEEQQEEVPVIPVNFEENFGNQVTARFMGSVIDEESNPVQGAMVRIGNTVASTDIFGIFSIESSEVYERFAYITVQKSEYITGSRALIPSVTEVNRVEIMLLKEDVIATINSGQQATVNLPNGTAVTFDGNFIRANGSAYNSAVKVILKHLSPDDDNMNVMMPGMLFAQDASGDPVALETYGMVAVELRSDSGEELQLAEDSVSQLSMPISSTASNPPATIPLWYFDEVEGYWKEEGQATLQGNMYVGEVSHFSFWNWDYPYPGINLCITLVDESGNPLSYSGLQIYSSLLNNVGNGYTDRFGTECGLVPADEELSITVQVAGCPNDPFTTTIGPFSTDTNTTITVTSINTTILIGTFLTCDGDNVTDGYLQLFVDGELQIIPVTDGSINHVVSYCENTDYTIKGIDFGSSQTTGFITGNLDGSDTIDVGVISACVAFSDTDGDSIIDELEDINQDGDFDNDDTDGDGTPNYLDIDDDNDSINTSNEDVDGVAGPTNDDADADGIPNYLDADDDNDGINTIDEDVDGDTDVTNDDTDVDGTANYLDSDDDDDSVETINEDVDQDGDVTNDDTDSDNTPNYLDSDDDNDSIETINEDVDGDGDLGNDDTDDDGIPNYLDVDDDGDGIDTADEDYDGDNDPTNEDSDGDNIPDYLDEEDVIVFSTEVQGDTCTDPQVFDLNTITTNSGDTLHTYAYYATQVDANTETNELPTSYSVGAADIAAGHIIYVKATNTISGQTAIGQVTLLWNTQNADGDGLTDCEELTGIDDPSTGAIPTGTSDPNDPNDPNVTPITIYMSMLDIIGESIGQAPITFTLGAISDVDTIIDVSTTDGTAESGSDYTSVNTTITILAGQLSEIVNIPIIDDQNTYSEQQRETLNVNGTVISGNTTMTDITGIVTIHNDDLLRFYMFDSYGYENDGSIEVKVGLSVPVYVDTVISFSVTDDTTAPDDYSLSTTSLIIPAGETLGSIFVIPNNDGIVENSESFEIIANINSGTSNVTRTINVFIYDDDATNYREFAYITGCDFYAIGDANVDLTTLNEHLLNGNPGTISYSQITNFGEVYEITSPETYTYSVVDVASLTARIETPTGSIINNIPINVQLLSGWLQLDYSNNLIIICDSSDGIVSNGIGVVNLITSFSSNYQNSLLQFVDLTLTYHESLADAESGVNAISLPENYTTNSSSQTIYVRIVEPFSECTQIKIFTVNVDPGC